MTISSNCNVEDNNLQTELVEKPNFLIIMVDEERFPPPYENDTIKKWREKYLKAQTFLQCNGVEFKNHYAASTACSPSRASLYTGQYPSLHGVTETDGGGSTAFSGKTFWLDPNTVPTLGDYLRTAGYSTYWKGKWHASHPDIIIPGTHNSYLSYDSQTGVPIPKSEEIYLNANRLNEYGFDGWIGPEPHGPSPHNSGSSAAIGVSGRDVIYSAEVTELLERLENRDIKEKGNTKPWAIVASFVNPHDIALFGAFTRLQPTFNFEIDSSVPQIPAAPTANETLATKPRAQASYREVYPRLIQPLADTETYRRLYYSLQLNVDREIWKVIEALKNSVFYDNTFIIYTSDHGDMLGAHGGLFQKWYVAYEEAIHVPLFVFHPKITPKAKSVDTLTNHVDILPTVLGLAGIESNKALEKLKGDHTEAHPLVGKDLAPLIFEEQEYLNENDPVYFMTDDDPSRTFNSTSPLGIPFVPVTQPCHIETVIVKLPTGENFEQETWKYSRYFDNPQFWSDPGQEDKNIQQKCTVSTTKDADCGLCTTTIKTGPAQEEIEMYNLTKDPLESENLANLQFATCESRMVQVLLRLILAAECRKKRIYPSSEEIPGKPSCINPRQPYVNL